MTVKSDIEKAIASEQSAVGTYAMFADSTDDPSAKQMFQQMQQDAERHIQILNGRLTYLSNNSPLYGQPPGGNPPPKPDQKDPKVIQTDKLPKGR